MAYLQRVAVWERTDGGISITYFDERDKLQGESDDELIERMSKKHGVSPQLSGARRTIIDQKDILSDRGSRQHWSLINGKIQVDQKKVDLAAKKEAKKAETFKKLGVSKQELKEALE